ncbi:MAG TPA: hypothetical protein VG755_04950 [Nannocystaceae bacterium]|nr:hypothetical protein [Nannocystaceae bacterium]
MLACRRFVAVMLVCGCGPSVDSGDGSQSGSGGSEATSDVTATGPGPASTEGSVATASDTAIDTSVGDTGIVDDTCVHGDPSACPEGCYSGEAWRVVDVACTASRVAICLPGGPKPGVPLTTYWAIAASGPVFVEYGSSCSVAAQPETWRECSGAPDEPADCACFCQDGACLGDADRLALEACEAEVPCDSLPIIADAGAADHDAERCVLEHLRDRTPGLHELVVSNLFGASVIRLYVVGEQVWRITQFNDHVGSCPTVSGWGPAELCTLAPADFFATCLEPSAPGDECVLHLDAWLHDCVEQPPSCD